jgi:sterol 3beta-glucosyltransferase
MFHTLNKVRHVRPAGWRESGFTSSATVHYVDSAPHAEVFSHCKAIIHHGGAGTSQAALLAGKPSILVTRTSEQEFWGRELARIGVAPKPLSRKTLTADQLAGKIALIATSKIFNEAAVRVGVEMAKEDGVATAVRLINEKFTALHL